MLSALVQQVAFRWRFDDGSETLATWAEVENAAITVNTASPVKLRVRLVVAETNGDENVRNQQYWIQANLNGGTFVTLTEVDQGVGFALILSDFVTDGIFTTEQLVTNPAPFEPGHFVSQDPVGLAITLGGGERTEWEYCIVLDPTPFVSNDVFLFRIVGDGDIPLDAYQIFAEFTLQKPTIVNFSGSAVAAAGASSGNNRTRGMTGSADALASVQSDLTWIGLLKGAVSALAQTTGLIKVTKKFVGAVLGVATITAPLLKLSFLGTGSAAAVASVTGRIIAVIVLGTLSAVGVAVSSASMSVARGQVGSVIGLAAAQCRMTVFYTQTAAISAIATTSGKLSKQLPSSGQSQFNVFGN